MSAIRMKLVDLLTILSFSEPAKRPRERGAVVQSKTVQYQITACPRQRIDEADLRAVQEFLMNRNATRRDLEFALNMSDGMVLRRLVMLRERGTVEHLPGNVYGLTEEHYVGGD
ncbi:MAG: hypothetical protein A4E49_00154 [Methanosaeta sp. PtaU1.Bin112]|nr:MAG: hypothetical protein A4E49_00154 [Methanosaeta sp. PtaU1.Bin112]